MLGQTFLWTSAMAGRKFLNLWFPKNLNKGNLFIFQMLSLDLFCLSMNHKRSPVCYIHYKQGLIGLSAFSFFLHFKKYLWRTRQKCSSSSAQSVPFPLHHTRYIINKIRYYSQMKNGNAICKVKLRKIFNIKKRQQTTYATICEQLTILILGFQLWKTIEVACSDPDSENGGWAAQGQLIMVTRGRTVAVGHQPGGEGESTWDEVLHHSARMRWHMCEKMTADQTHDDHQGKWNHLQSSSWWLCQCGNVHPWGVTQIWPLLRYSALRFLTFYVWGKWIFPFQGNSMECGMATGCVKIIKRAFEFDHLGGFIPLHKRDRDVELFRGKLGIVRFILLALTSLVKVKCILQ